MKIRKVLLEAGTIGIARRELMDKCRTHIHKRPDIQDQLDLWLVERRVQKFMVKESHSDRPIEQWRATTLLLDVKA
jgi:hypothetical protein